MDRRATGARYKIVVRGELDSRYAVLFNGMEMERVEGTTVLTGRVSDAMCGAKHMMAGNPAECTRACIGKGSKYALVVGDRVYTLETKNKTALDSLNKLAGEQATITGKLNGETIEVSSVASGQ